MDRKECLVMEIKKFKEEKIIPVIGFSIYSNSLPTVLSYSTIFEVLYNQSILAQELRHEGEDKDDFINTAAHELRTPTQTITGYSEINGFIFDDFLKNKNKMTDQDLKEIIMSLYTHHESISKSVTRLNILINNLLEVTRFESRNNSDIILYRDKVDLVRDG